MITTYIALGSNLDNPYQHVQQASLELAQLKQSFVVASSSLYKSSPMGPLDQDDFINAVVAVNTTLTPQELLTQLQTLEHTHGRQRTRHWGPRTLDLDILLYGNECIKTTDLTIPHPGLHQRNFVLIPLSEIAPELILPNGIALKTYLETVDNAGLVPTSN